MSRDHHPRSHSDGRHDHLYRSRGRVRGGSVSRAVEESACDGQVPRQVQPELNRSPTSSSPVRETRTVSIQPPSLGSRPRVTTNLRGIQYARETVQRTRPSSSTTTPTVAQKTKNCLVCGPVTTSNVRRHIDQTHVHWFVSPEYCCWEVPEELRVSPFTSVHSQNNHLMTTDERLGDWVCRTNVLLKELYQCEDLEELLLMVQQRNWHPTEFVVAESERQFLQMRMWAFKTCRPVPTEYQLCPLWMSQPWYTEP